MKLINKVIKKEIKKLKRVKDTFDERFDYLRLDKNERLLPVSEKSMKDLYRRIKYEDLSGYTELGSIYRRLARYLGVKDNQMLLASGSDLAIKSVFEACIEKGDNIIVHLPCYAMYRVYAKMFGIKAKTVPIRNDWSINIEKMLSMVDNRTKFMVVENPNGFVGTKPTIEEIEKCASFLKKKNVLLLVDEVYNYVENNDSKVIPLIDKYPNLIVSQSFSKGHGLAGARLGYLIGEIELIEHISRVRPMHEITGLTAVAAEWVLDSPEMLAEYQQSIRESKNYLKKEMSSLGIKYRDTHANFMLFYLPDRGRTKDLALKLRGKKVLIRRPFEEVYLQGWSRVCVGSVEDSRCFIIALKQILR